MAGRRREGLSGQSVFLARACLRRAFNDAIRYQLADTNPASAALPPRRDRFIAVPLDPVQAKVLLRAAKDDRLEALYSVALALGLREGEIIGLRWPDVDFDKGVLSLGWQLQWFDRRPVFSRPKGKDAARLIHMPAPVVQALREHRIRQEQERMRAGDQWTGLGTVFAKANGAPYRGEGVYQHFQRLLKRAGLPPRRFHDLRHSTASLLLAMGVSIDEVSDVLGHSDLNFTKRTYAHLIDAAGLNAADRMGEFMEDM